MEYKERSVVTELIKVGSLIAVALLAYFKWIQNQDMANITNTDLFIVKVMASLLMGCTFYPIVSLIIKRIRVSILGIVIAFIEIFVWVLLVIFLIGYIGDNYKWVGEFFGSVYGQILCMVLVVGFYCYRIVKLALAIFKR